MNAFVVQVTPEELEEIRPLHLRRLAIRDLLPQLRRLSPQEGAEMYERMLRDHGETLWRIDRWWVAMTSKYSLEGEMDLDIDTGKLERKG